MFQHPEICLSHLSVDSVGILLELRLHQLRQPDAHLSATTSVEHHIAEDETFIRVVLEVILVAVVLLKFNNLVFSDRHIVSALSQCVGFKTIHRCRRRRICMNRNKQIRLCSVGYLWSFIQWNEKILFTSEYHLRVFIRIQQFPDSQRDLQVHILLIDFLLYSDGSTISTAMAWV